MLTTAHTALMMVMIMLVVLLVMRKAERVRCVLAPLVVHEELRPTLYFKATSTVEIGRALHVH